MYTERFYDENIKRFEKIVSSSRDYENTTIYEKVNILHDLALLKNNIDIIYFLLAYLY